MLETFNIGAIDTVLSFIGATMSYYYNFITLLTSQKSLQIVDFTNFDFRKYQDLVCTEKEICSLEEGMMIFEALTYKMFDPYQAPNMSTQKGRPLDHICYV